MLTLFATSALYVIKTKEEVFDFALSQAVTAAPEKNIPAVEAFPLGVNPLTQVITEHPSVDTYFDAHITSHTKKESKLSWLEKHFFSKLTTYDWYQNLASPISRILVIDSGERKEEVVDNIGDILRWDDDERIRFANLIAGSSPKLAEGKFFPERYVVNKDATPEEVANLLIAEFNTQVLSRYSEDIEKVVPIEDAITIASLLQREAYDFEDMRYISGIIWNRLFTDMKLQLDASLQYAKANGPSKTWWPVVVPDDKFIKSPFNTYENKGLPPSPIANPSAEAILAALNPKKTECIFYFHDSDGGFHCTKTYEEHVRLIKQYYPKNQ